MLPMGATEIPPLVELLEICGAAGTVAGAIVGFTFRAPTDRDLASNVILASGIGFVIGLTFGFVVGIVNGIAGG